jgi:hypothetical protein
MNKEEILAKMKLSAEEMVDIQSKHAVYFTRLNKVKDEFCIEKKVNWNLAYIYMFNRYLTENYGFEMNISSDEYTVIDPNLYLLYILKFG